MISTIEQIWQKKRRNMHNHNDAACISANKSFVMVIIRFVYAYHLCNVQDGHDSRMRNSYVVGRICHLTVLQNEVMAEPMKIVASPKPGRTIELDNKNQLASNAETELLIKRFSVWAICCLHKF